MSYLIEKTPPSSRPGINQDQAADPAAAPDQTTQRSDPTVAQPSGASTEAPSTGTGAFGAPTAVAQGPQEPGGVAGAASKSGVAPPPAAVGVANVGQGEHKSDGRSDPGRTRGVGARLSRSYRLRELVWLAVLVVDAFLALDFLFRAIAATSDGFVLIVLRVGNALASPFAGLFSNTTAVVGRTSFWSAVLAIVIYSLAAWVVTRFITLLAGHSKRRAV